MPALSVFSHAPRACYAAHVLLILAHCATGAASNVTLCRSTYTSPHWASACCSTSNSTLLGSCCQVHSPYFGSSKVCLTMEPEGPYLSDDMGIYGHIKMLAHGDPTSFVYAELGGNLACSSSSHTGNFVETYNATIEGSSGTIAYSPPPPMPPVTFPGDAFATICRVVISGRQTYSGCCSTSNVTALGTCCTVSMPSVASAKACMTIEADGPHLSLDMGQYGNYKLDARGDPSSFLVARANGNLGCDEHHSAPMNEMLNFTIGKPPPPSTPPPPQSPSPHPPGRAPLHIR